MTNPYEGPKAVDEPEPTIDPGPAEARALPEVDPSELELLTTSNALLDAELIVARLRGSNVPAWLKDQHIVSAHSMIAPVVGGVKVLVRKRDLESARELLEVGQKGGRIFVVHRRSPIAYTALGALAGGFIGFVGFEIFQLGPLMGVSTVLGALEGLRRGLRGVTYCSRCMGLMTLSMTTCPKCEGTVAGTISHPRERLEAEERLPAASPTDE